MLNPSKSISIIIFFQTGIIESSFKPRPNSCCWVSALSTTDLGWLDGKPSDHKWCRTNARSLWYRKFGTILDCQCVGILTRLPQVKTQGGLQCKTYLYCIKKPCESALTGCWWPWWIFSTPELFVSQTHPVTSRSLGPDPMPVIEIIVGSWMSPKKIP